MEADEPRDPGRRRRRKSEPRAGLPFGPFDPLAHRTFEIGLRAWVEAQTGLRVGYVEQLYTFGDRGRHARPGRHRPHMVSVGYLALTRMPDNAAALREGRRRLRALVPLLSVGGLARRRPAILDDASCRCSSEWTAPPHGEPAARSAGASGCGFASAPAARRGTRRRCSTATRCSTRRAWSRRRGATAARPRCRARKLPALGEPMRFDHRRILATAIARLRAKLKYRPVVFELMPAEFTLTELQRTVEAISGRHLHKQNFRRLVESAALVEPTGETSTATGGRPAALFRFRREVLCRSGRRPGCGSADGLEHRSFLNVSSRLRRPIRAQRCAHAPSALATRVGCA